MSCISRIRKTNVVAGGRDALLRDPGMHVPKLLFSLLTWLLCASRGYGAYSRLIEARCWIARERALPIRRQPPLTTCGDERIE